MIKEIKIYNRFNMEMFARGQRFPYSYWYLISIHSGDILVTPHVRKAFEEIGCQGIMSLEFWDITPTDRHTVLREHPDAIMFDESHAKKIIKFIKRVQEDKKDSTLVIHCHAGISRSGATGTFACDYCGLDYNAFLKINPDLNPNAYVLSMLKREAGMVPDFKSHKVISYNEKAQQINGETK